MSNLAISLSTFTFNNLPVRTTEINNQLWFLANDVCSILEYKNSRRAIELHCKEKGVTKRYTLTNGGEQEMIYISESNLFRLIIKSKQEKAVIFEEWVMEDLLPTIRKTGSYSLTINSEQQQAIKQAVNQRSYRTGEHYQVVYSKLYEHFKIPRYQDLPASKFDDAIKWLGGIKVKSTQFNDDELCTLAWCYKAGESMRRNIKALTEALYLIKSDYAASFYSQGKEYERTLENARAILERETRHIIAEKQEFLAKNWINVLPVIRQRQINQF